MLTQVTQTTTLSASRTYFGSIPIILSTLLFLVIGWGCDDETGFNSGGSPDINVSPNPITLTAVPIGQTTSKKITIKNVGEGTLRVIDLYLSSELSSLEFSLTMPEGIDNSFELETGEDIELMLNYSPSNEGLDRGRLVIVNNSLSAVDTQNMTSISIETTIGQSDLIYDTRAVFVLNPCDTNDVHWHEFKNYPDIKEKFTNIVFKSCKNILLVTNSYHFLKDSQIWRKIDD